MKQLVFTLIFISSIALLHAQEQKTDRKPKKFHIGLSYVYINADLELCDMTHESKIGEAELDPFNLSEEDLDDLNSFMKWNNQTQSLCLSFGMFLLNKTDSRWQIDANLIFGLSKMRYLVRDTRNDTAEQISKTGFCKPTVGVEFKVKYAFNNLLGILVEPCFIYSWGELTPTKDRLNAGLENFTISREHDFHYIYSRINVMASYTHKRFSFSIGPGLYYLFFTNRYKLVRTNQLSGSTTEDLTTSQLHSKFPLDGVLDVTWRMMDPLTFHVECAIGSDVRIQSGIFFNF